MAVLGIAGPKCTGKSYYLEILLQYLKATKKDRRNDEWFQPTDFSSKFGYKKGFYKFYRLFTTKKALTYTLKFF